MRFWGLYAATSYIYIGRLKGKNALEKRSRWQAKSEKVLVLLHRHQYWLMIGFRFICSMRTVTPFVIGASNISPTRFLVFNFIGAALWAATIGVLGYQFGRSLEIILGNLRRYEMLLFAVLAAADTAAWLIGIRKNRAARKSLQATLEKPSPDA